MKKQVVFLVCTGLGRINRGYESFSRECFDALKNNDLFDLYLVKGGGQKKDKEIVLPNLHRKSAAAKWMYKLTRVDPYTVEQFTFCMTLLPLIIRKKPSVIYYSEFILGTYLWHLRKLLKFRYQLLFSNGAPNGPPFKTEDHIQQLLPLHLEKAIKEGEPALKQTLLPYGFQIDAHERQNSLHKREELRTRFGFSDHQKIILSVGAINIHHKRMDYIINELSDLPDNYFLVILGQYEPETPWLIHYAQTKLPGRHLIANVPYSDVENYYIAADFSVLASFSEGFGRVIIEALSYGLPCLLHDCVNTRQLLHDFGIYLHMNEAGALSNYLIRQNIYQDKTKLINTAHDLYSWDVLKKDYVHMISKLIGN